MQNNEQSIYKKRACLLIIIPLLFTLSIAFGNYYIDPAGVYHSPFHATCYTFEGKALIAGRINQANKDQNYSTLIAGSSLSTNLTSEKTSNLFHNGQTLNISFSGTGPKSIYLTVDHALRHNNKVKYVILELYHHYKKDYDFVKDTFPEYLFNDDLSDDSPYLLSPETLLSSFNNLTNHCKSNSLENITAWNNDVKHKNAFTKFNSPENLANIKKEMSEEKMSLSGYFYTNMATPAVDNYILPLATKYPNIEFILYIPPTSILDLTNLAKDDLNRYFSMAQNVLNASRPNIKIYALNWNKDITTNFSFYRDKQHYSEEVDNLVITMLKNKQYEVTKDNFATFVKEMSQLITSQI